ncbi:hypothetical protein HY212_03865 [Candidatus Pacearchaeota archaeon]|nr:hypothetical protein [Candidatus Pacearchaeota archaeon]
MNTLKSLRIIAATTFLGSIALAGAKDIKTENIRERAANENRALTRDEIKSTTSPSFPFYLAAGSFPTWFLVRQLDEKRQTKKKDNEEITDYQI